MRYTGAFILSVPFLLGCTNVQHHPTEPVGGREPVRAADVVGGSNYECALVGNGSARCTGALSPGTSWGDMVFISGGAEHACGVTSEGLIRCWGTNVYNKLFPPPGTNRNFREVAAGTQHTCGLHADGSILCWGLNDNGQTDAPAGTGYHGINASRGGHHTCALTVDDAIICWGLNNQGQTAGLPGTGYRSVIVTETGGCGLTPDRIRCWGELIPGLPADDGVTSLSAGRDFVCAVRGGSVTCWGASNHNGALNPPVDTDFVRVGAGFTHVCGLQATGLVKCWGSITGFPELSF